MNTDFPSPPCNNVSFWLRNGTQFAEYRTSSTLPDSAEVVIIGGGVTGVGIAYWLYRNGFQDILLLEARGIASGASGRNGGILSPHPVYVPEETDRAEFERWNNFEYETTDLIRNVVEREKLDCDLFFTGGMRCVQEETDGDSFGMNLISSSPSSECWSKEKMTALFDSDLYTKGIYRPAAGQIHTAKFVWGLTQLLVNSGHKINIQTQTKVTYVENLNDSKVKVTTERGSVTAHYVVYATNAYSRAIIPEAFKPFIRPKQAQVISSIPIDGIPEFNLTWNEGNEYMIYRVSDKRVVFGGFEDTLPHDIQQRFDDSGINAEISSRILEFLGKIPRLSKIKVEHEWIGIQGFTPDEQPLVGRLSPTEFIAAGFSGHGMPRAFGCAKIVAEAICGKDVNWIKIYSPFRFQDT